MDKILFSSISKKFVMALAGIFLLLFLPVHFVINLLLLKSDPVPFNRAAHFMATFPLIKILEVLLMASILIHIVYGVYIQIQNWLARPVGYVSGLKARTNSLSRFMIWTGATVLIFLIIHFFNFYFIKIGYVAGEPENFYSTAYNLFRIPAYNYIYLTSFLLLGFHLHHSFYSAFQTLGLNHRIWTPVVKVFAWIYSIAIPAGFAFISITIWQFR
jgi:succinate dehydrogenase / fumarate reductase cytochrome b subunit